jgi:hypothetical protein
MTTFLFGSEVWATSAEDRRRIGVMEMKCMRSMCEVSILVRVRNEKRGEGVAVNQVLVNDWMKMC